MDGRDIWVLTTSFLFGASHAVSYVYIFLKTFDLDLSSYPLVVNMVVSLVMSSVCLRDLHRC